MSDEDARARKLLRRGIVGIHLLQLPLYLGLMLALILFGMTFFYAIVESVVNRDFLNRNTAILLVLDLLDMVFITNLIVMVMVGGYNSYISALRGMRREDGFMSYSDAFAPVKSRITATLVIISGIHVLHEILSGENRTVLHLLVLGALHLVLLTSAVAFAYIARFTESDGSEAPK